MSKSFIIKKKEMNTSDWFGGKTTQLFIYPSNSTLKNIDFDFRLSTATIEIEKSDFTPLPGVDRTLLLLEGELKLDHKDHHSINIPLFDVDNFKGDWQTTSFGKAIDFNLMTTKNYNSTISTFSFTNKTSYKEHNFNDYTFIFIYKGSLSTNYGEMKEGDLLVVNNDEYFELKSNETDNCTIVRLSISLLN